MSVKQIITKKSDPCHSIKHELCKQWHDSIRIKENTLIFGIEFNHYHTSVESTCYWISYLVRARLTEHLN